MLTPSGGLGTWGWGLARRSPWRKTWNPSRNILAELLVFFAECRAHGRFFIRQNEEVRHQPGPGAVFQHMDVSEQQGLSNNDGYYCDVHRIPNTAIPSGDHQMLGRKNWRRRAQTLDCKSSEGVQQHRESGQNQRDAGDPQWDQPEERWLHLPARDPPWHETSHRTRCEDEKQRGSEDR
jgi:hypothetical protein